MEIKEKKTGRPFKGNRKTTICLSKPKIKQISMFYAKKSSMTFSSLIETLLENYVKESYQLEKSNELVDEALNKTGKASIDLWEVKNTSEEERIEYLMKKMKEELNNESDAPIHQDNKASDSPKHEPTE